MCDCRYFDKDGSGEVTLEEFLYGVTCVPELASLGMVLRWKATFDKYDADRSGFVDFVELRAMVTELVSSNGVCGLLLVVRRVCVWSDIHTHGLGLR